MPPTNASPSIPEPPKPVQSEFSSPQSVYPPSSSPTPQQSNLPAPTETGMFSGRLDRMGYLMAVVYFIAFFAIPIIIAIVLRGQDIGNIISILAGLVGVVLGIPVSLSVGIRRWHDMGKSGFFILLGFIPLVGFIVLFFYLFVEGTNGPNQYGGPDTRPSSIGKVLFNK